MWGEVGSEEDSFLSIEAGSLGEGDSDTAWLNTDKQMNK